MDHPLHRLVGMRRAGWWVITLHGCIGDVLGPYATSEEAERHREGWLQFATHEEDVASVRQRSRFLQD
jgi:hypothetical protein